MAKYVRLTDVTYPNGREVLYGYGTTGAIDDIMSRLATIGDGTDTYAAYKYLGAGRIVTEDYEEIEVKLDQAADDLAALDRFVRVVDQVWEDYGAEPDVTLDRYTCAYDRAGNRTGKDNELHAAFDEDYTYNGLDELISSSRADDFDQSWTLDGLGNFSAFDDDGTSQTRTGNAANEITGITGGWITPAYDAAGNMISGPTPGDEDTRIHYVYDAWNRLVEVRADDSGEPGDTLASYEYDGTNRRIEKVLTTEGGGPSHAHYYYNHQWQMLEEPFVDGQGATVASNEYVWSPRYIDSPVVRFHDGNGDGDLLDAGDNIRYYTTDANHNVTATIDAATGDVVERYVYAPYGTATVYDDDWANPVAPTTDGPLYCGYFFDADTGLHQVRNRYYDASLSTFISRDPIGFDAHDMNLYRYVNNQPSNGTDPSGRESPYVVYKYLCDIEEKKRAGTLFLDVRENWWYIRDILSAENIFRCGYGCGGVAAWRAGCEPRADGRYYPVDIPTRGKVYETWPEAVKALEALGAEGGLIIAMQWIYADRHGECPPDNWVTLLGCDPRSRYWECVNHCWAGSPGKDLDTAKVTHQLTLPRGFQHIEYVVVPGGKARFCSPLARVGDK